MLFIVDFLPIPTSKVKIECGQDAKPSQIDNLFLFRGAEIAAADGIVSEEAARKAVGAARARLLVQLRKTGSR